MRIDKAIIHSFPVKIIKICENIYANVAGTSSKRTANGEYILFASRILFGVHA